MIDYHFYLTVIVELILMGNPDPKLLSRWTSSCVSCHDAPRTTCGDGPQSPLVTDTVTSVVSMVSSPNISRISLMYKSTTKLTPVPFTIRVS